MLYFPTHATDVIALYLAPVPPSLTFPYYQSKPKEPSKLSSNITPALKMTRFLNGSQLTLFISSLCSLGFDPLLFSLESCSQDARQSLECESSRRF